MVLDAVTDATVAGDLTALAHGTAMLLLLSNGLSEAILEAKPPAYQEVSPFL